MSIAWNPTAVATAISGLSISGVTIKDLDKIPDSAEGLCPIIFPQPDGFISNIRPESQSLGSLGTQKENVTYSLHYVYLFSEVGSGISAFTPYSPLITQLTTVINAILNNDVVSGLVDMQLESMEVGQVNDPAGVPFWGALFSLTCLEYAQ